MTTRRIQLGSYVHLRRKTEPLSVWGFIESEEGPKIWNVQFYSKDKTEVKTSGQLSYADKTELPKPIAEWLGVWNEDADKENETPTLTDSSPTPRQDPRLSLEGSVDTPDSEPDLIERRKSIYGKSVVRSTFRPELVTVPANDEVEEVRARVLFRADNDDDSDGDSDDNDEAELADGEDEDEIILAVDKRSLFDEALLDALEGGTSDFIFKKERAAKEKRELIRRKTEVIVKNGNLRSKWRVIDDLDEPDNITAEVRREEEIGVVDLDFNKLAEADFPLVEVFLRFWPGDATKQLRKLNLSFEKKHRTAKPVTLREFFVFFACLLSAAPAGFGGEKLWKPSQARAIFPHPDLNGIMKYKRFSQIKSCFADAFAYDGMDAIKENWAPIAGTHSGNDPWARLQGLVNDFNKTVKRNFSSSDRKCLDESMSPWKPRASKHGNLPHLSFILRKPKPLGTEFKSTACAATGIMLHLEIQRGKAPMKQGLYQKKLGACTACTLRMAEATASPNDTFYGDSWFASVKTAEEVRKRLGCHFIGHVKTSHKKYPKEWLLETMKEWPGGTHIVLESCFNKDLIAVGYKYNSRKVCMFIMTRGAELTGCGDPYDSKFRTEKGNYRTRDVMRPLVASKYFQASGAIDGNNQIRQGELALETHWKTNDGWFRCVCTILGIAVANAFYACNYSFSSECEYSKLKSKDFASILSHQLVQYPFPASNSFGRKVVKAGEELPQWFEVVIPGRFDPKSLNANVLLDLTNNTPEPTETLKVGKTELKSGWSYNRIEAVSRPAGAPELPVDIREAHKQTKIKIEARKDRNRHRPPPCRLCKAYGLKMKRPPFLCADCGQFFCHDVELSTGSSFPRQCYWTHMCVKYKDSGLATGVWIANFETWNEKRVEGCRASDEA